MSDKLVSEKDLTLLENSFLNVNQLQFLHKTTPEKYIKSRPAKGGGQWKYISGGYVKKTLNLMFAWDWDFEILEQLVLHGEAIVKGKLTVRTNGRTVVKTQFGNKDIIYKRLQEGETERQPLSIGNDLKAAATDCLKKCAAELGIGADIYNREEFESFIIVEESEEELLLNELKAIFEAKKDKLEAKLKNRVEEIIEKNELASYKKAIDNLKNIQ